MFLCLITCLSRSGIGIFSMSQDFLEIWAEVPLIPGLFRSGFFLYLNTALFAFRPVVLETVVTAVYVGLAVPIFGTLSGTFGTFSGTFGTLSGTALATCGKSVSKLYILCQIWLSLTSAFPNNTSYG